MTTTNVPTKATQEQADRAILAAIAAGRNGDVTKVQRAVARLLKASAGAVDPDHLRMLKRAQRAALLLGCDEDLTLGEPEELVRDIRDGLVRLVMAPGTTTATSAAEAATETLHARGAALGAT